MICGYHRSAVSMRETSLSETWLKIYECILAGLGTLGDSPRAKVIAEGEGLDFSTKAAVPAA